MQNLVLISCHRFFCLVLVIICFKLRFSNFFSRKTVLKTQIKKIKGKFRGEKIGKNKDIRKHLTEQNF